MKGLNRYVKVKGHRNWFLVLTEDDYEPDNFSDNMQERMLRSEVCGLHNDTPKARMDFVHRLTLLATRTLNYENLAKKYGTILVREIGSFMPLYENEITEEIFDSDFPIIEFSEIVICENDRQAEYKWVKYLEKKFPDKKIITINYFDLRSDVQIVQYFEHAKYITFSTTFSDFGWFKKLTNHMKEHHKVIGYCHDVEKWEQALAMNPRVKVIKKISDKILQ